MDNISRDHVTDMELLRRYSKVLCFIDVYCRYDWVLPLKNNKGEAITKPNKIWIDKGSKFWNRSKKLWAERNNVEIYSILNKRRLVVVAQFITTLKNKIYKNVASAFENIYIDKLPEIVKKIIKNNTTALFIKQSKWNLLMSNLTHILAFLLNLI